MEITRLRVSGFKSFSEPAELQLEPGLTGVVGPNGCGKSNIVEALRWVMGESSAKGLRGEGMDDVIFNGCATRPAHDLAEVRLKLRGRPEGLAGFAEEGEFDVARRIGRGTGSVYRINGREARARDVQLLFADAGAGSRSPAIVGQGQIGFIVDSRPCDRRKLLEDAAGIGGLQARRREAELRLEATRANLQRVLDLLASQEARLAELTKQGRQAQRYRQLSAELRTTEAHLLLARHIEASRRAAAANQQVAALGSEHERREEAAASGRRARTEATAALPPLRERAAALQAESTGLRERLASLREAASREADHLATLIRQRDEAAQDLARAESAAAACATAIVTLDGEAAALAAEQAMSGGAIESHAEADRLGTDVLAAAQEAVRGMVAQAAEAIAQRDAAAVRLASLERRRREVEEELAALPPLGSPRNKAARAETAVAARERELTAARAALERASEETGRLAPAREGVRSMVVTVEREVISCRERLAAAELQSREIRAMQGRLAERRGALERGLARLAERQAAHQRRCDLLASGAADADPDAFHAAMVAAESDLAAADFALDAAREALANSERAHAASISRGRDLRRSADALDTEIRVLESLAPAGHVGSLLDRLDVPEDLTSALAAALGDDLLAGTEPDAPQYWSASAADLPAARLPAGVTPLLGQIGAPALLEARLARTGVAEPNGAAALQTQLLPGHRLVSRDGGLWRWDGYVRAPGGEDPAAARVRHHLRLYAARDEFAALSRELAEADADAAAVDQATEAARQSLAEAEVRWRAADAAQLRAVQRLDEGRVLAERRSAEAGQLEREAAALASDRAELEREQAAIATAGLDADEAPVAAAEAAAQTELAQALRRLSAVEADLCSAEDGHAVALRTQRSCEEAVERTTAEAEQARRVFDAATRSAAEQEADRRARAAALEREQAELAAAAVDAENTLAATTELAAARVAERKVAETGLAEAEKAKRDVADALARVRAETAALVRRAEGLVRSRAETSARLAEAQTLAEELRRRLDRLVGELALAERGRRSDPAALAELEDALSTATAAWEKARHELERQEETARALEEEAAQFDEAFAAVREQLAVAEAERGHAHAALAASVTAVRDRLLQEPLALLADEATRAAVAEADPDELELRLGRLRASRDRLGPVNLRADVEAAELGAAVAETRAREAEMQQAVERLRAGIGTLDREARERLLAAFEAVDGHFRRLFTVLFGGGKAHLRLAGTDDPLEAGLELEASPPGKKLSSISLLSGGEKTLAALALVFGFFLAQPSPLCVLDEVDAPLDDANVERFIGLMEEIAQSGTRFLVVTHHPLTMARMHRLYGVTMAERGISRLVSVALEQALELRATA